MDFFNSLSSHPWLQAIVFWDFPLAKSFGRVLPAGFQLVFLCPVHVGAGLALEFCCCPKESSSCPLGTRVLCGYHKENSPLLLLASSLASQAGASGSGRQRARVKLFSTPDKQSCSKKPLIIFHLSGVTHKAALP